MPKIKLPETDLIRLRNFLAGLKDENDEKITQDDMAKALFCDKKTIYRHVFDRNSQEVNSDTVKNICEHFKIDLAPVVNRDLWDQLISDVNAKNPTVKISYPPEFKSLIESRTKRFVGREFVTQAFHEFRQKNDRGYFTVLGEPGTGKSAIAANYVRSYALTKTVRYGERRKCPPLSELQWQDNYQNNRQQSVTVICIPCF